MAIRAELARGNSVPDTDIRRFRDRNKKQPAGPGFLNEPMPLLPLDNPNIILVDFRNSMGNTQEPIPGKVKPGIVYETHNKTGVLGAIRGSDGVISTVIKPNIDTEPDEPQQQPTARVKDESSEASKTPPFGYDLVQRGLNKYGKYALGVTGLATGAAALAACAPTAAIVRPAETPGGEQAALGKPITYSNRGQISSEISQQFAEKYNVSVVSIKDLTARDLNNPKNTVSFSFVEINGKSGKDFYALFPKGAETIAVPYTVVATVDNKNKTHVEYRITGGATFIDIGFKTNPRTSAEIEKTLSDPSQIEKIVISNTDGQSVTYNLNGIPEILQALAPRPVSAEELPPTATAYSTATSTSTETPTPKVEKVVESGKFSSSPDSRSTLKEIDSSSPLSITEILGGYGDYVKVKAKGADGKIVTRYVLSKSIEGADKLPKLSVDEVDWFTIKDLTGNGPLTFENPTRGWSQKTIARDLALPSTFRFAVEMAVSGQQAGIAFFGDLKHGGDNWYSGIKQFILLMNSNSSMVMINLRDGTSENPISKPIGVVLDGIVYAKFEGRKLTILNSEGKEMAVFPDVSALGQFPEGPFPYSVAKEVQLIAGPNSGVKVKRLTVDTPPDGKYQEPETPTPIPPTAEPKPTQKPQPPVTNTPKPDNPPPPATATPKQPDNTPVPPAPTATPPIEKVNPPIPSTEIIFPNNSLVIHNVDAGKYQLNISDWGFKDGKGYDFGLRAYNTQRLIDLLAKYANGRKLEIFFYDNLTNYPYLNRPILASSFMYFGKDAGGGKIQVYIALAQNWQPTDLNRQWIMMGTSGYALRSFLCGQDSNAIKGAPPSACEEKDIVGVGYPSILDVIPLK